MVIIIFSILLVIALTIWVLWTLESRIPKIKLNSSSTTIKDIQEWLELLSSKKKINGSILFNKNGKDLLSMNLGYKSTQKNFIDGDTIFQLASLSKSFTAFGTMLLVKKYNLNYDDLVTKHIKEFPYPEVTIRNLLNQTSSISSNYMLLAKKYHNFKDAILTLKDATKLICKYPDKVIQKPNTHHSYNNTNYILLARIIEIVSKESFEKYMKREVFHPLKMNNTRVWNLLSDTPLEKINNVATGIESYLGSNFLNRKTTWLDGVAGDRSIFSSMNDLKKWAKAWDTNSILNEEEMLEAFKLPKFVNGESSDYGFGWVIKTDMFWHNGEWSATKSLMMKNLKDNSFLIILDNSSNMRFDQISKELVAALSTI
jgi:CubicO group peptidase (beta-lactamase class C family)